MLRPVQHHELTRQSREPLIVDVRPPVRRVRGDEDTNEAVLTKVSVSSWLTLDAEYEVLEIYATPGKSIKFRLASDDAGTPALFDSAMFLAIETSIPASWVIGLSEGGELRIGPQEWMREGFWEEFFDRDPKAVREFEIGAVRRVEADDERIGGG